MQGSARYRNTLIGAERPGAERCENLAARDVAFGHPILTVVIPDIQPAPFDAVMDDLPEALAFQFDGRSTETMSHATVG